MKNENEFTDIFGDDFEVTYEENDGMTLDMSRDAGRSSQDAACKTRTDTAPLRRKEVRWKTAEDYADDFSDDFGDGYEDSYEDEDSCEDRRSDAAEDDTFHGDFVRKSRGVPLAAPIRKGGRTLSRLTASVVRGLTAVLILVITGFVTWTFWRASTPYGDIQEMLRTKEADLTLASYLCVAALFLLFELISLFWSMTRVRVRNGMETWTEDTGRGLFSFLLVFAASYLSFWVSPFLPEAPEAVLGVKGALEVFGSMHNVLFGLCTAGVISCIVRKLFA